MKESVVKKDLVDGIIHVTKGGAGFLPHEDFEEDIYIHRRNINIALNGDTVKVSVVKKKKGGRAEGEVVKILKRATEDFVGVLKKGPGSPVFEADDVRMYANIRVKNTGDAKPGDKVVVKIVRWKNTHVDPVGEVTKVLGRAGEHETEMQSVIITHGFSEVFPEEVLKEADEIGKKPAVSQKDIDERRDMRSIPTFTIDPKTAKDFDDAISIQILENGNVEVGIHIADVSHYVQEGTALDKDARKRATSVYLVDRVIPMLPEVLSNDICSLNPGVDRLAFSAIFTISKQYKDSPCTVVDRWFGRSVIRSQHRFTYQSAQEVVDGKEGVFKDELLLADTIAKSLRKEREKRGAISFDTEEIGFELDDKGKPVRVFVKDRLETMKLIEELMLLANREVAEWIGTHCKDKKEHQRTFIYRIHDTPDPDKIEELQIFLKAIGYDLGKDGNQIASKDIDKLLRDVKGKPEEALVQMATLRSMAKAIYSHKNIGHFSLGFQHYTHFTSPIRRYPDIIAHRILWSHLKGPEISKKEIESYQKAAITSSEREVAAVQAERESTKYKQIEFMQDKIGQEFDAIITGITEHGMYLAEKESRAEGMAHISSLKDDYYNYDQKKYALVGKKGKKYQLGDTVKVVLKNASLETRQIDWEVVD
ncbi:ribonuclease R [Candidatus Kaiserbacteria bacterium CG10_big_fil_rev_8_21_14_0_10_43_70]|uniref:Ribonuclease R n=1 Tax=Candidatus Kaiserbacteria bacterium CG10_big_fil_rev_8_21_14_0_10_43_70 TaxID=1974605 RepID=A0A2H0UJ10_9BACT|nr:MAG: ribonuclease R [Candidatus Kaiserbacteria bacterium CG10_big_fil_rev_8_21_14_0_10_43_70]